LYQGAELGSDNRIYFVPGHATRVMVCDPETDKVEQIGPSFVGNYKWLRAVGVKDNEILYGIPYNSESILRIHVATQQISTIMIPYEEFYTDPLIAEQQRKMERKYCGGGIAADGCVYAFPHNACNVLQIDPLSEKVSFVGPRLEGVYKWSGGALGMQDGAIYCVPHSSRSPLTQRQSFSHGDNLASASGMVRLSGWKHSSCRKPPPCHHAGRSRTRAAVGNQRNNNRLHLNDNKYEEG
jgi:hypothetical protein